MKTLRLALLLTFGTFLFPCSPDTNPRFIPGYRLEQTDDRFVKGQLGILTFPLQMTALASWCEADNRIDSVCRHATGVSTDEIWPAHHPGRLYVFNPKPWTLANYRSLQNKQ